MSNDSILAIEGLSKRFMLHERAKVIDAFCGVTLRVSLGQMIVLVGASGAGKSSLLKCIYRTYLPTSGRMIYRTREGASIDLASASEPEILELRRSEIRYVSQFLLALPRRSALDVVARPLLELGQDLDTSREKAGRMLAQVGLPEHLWEVPPHTFSGGERQLVNLARAWIVQPRLMLLDEPTSSLDHESTEQVVQSIERLKRKGLAIISVFHDREIANRLADRKLDMHGGISWATEGVSST